MALNPKDPSGGFHHAEVVAFINEKMARHAKGPEFYLENMSLSWPEVEAKLGAILEDSEMSNEVKEACTWGSLALGVRFAHRQSQLQGLRVQWLHDFAKLHRSAAKNLAADLKKLTEQQELERKRAAFQLQLLRASLADVQMERDQLKWKLLQAEQQQPLEPATRWSSMAIVCGAWTEGEGEQEEEAVAAAATFPASATGEEEERDMAGAAIAPATRATQELSGTLLKFSGATGWEKIISGGQREGERRLMETDIFCFSEPAKPKPIVTQASLPVQLPPLFSYLYPLSTFPNPPKATLSPPAAHPSSILGASNVSFWSDVGTQAIEPQEPQRRIDFEYHQKKRPPIVCRLGDWDCPWCKVVNFSWREICFRCGRRIWLQKP
ncbi:testis-expressed protein 13A [Orycteropus afer afer]|uniref:Testis-expressed protein 13A n=1 Tax=Orycteropus afer afer TaxID=1230840 RepID=A0AC54ZAQ3_ORYAF|nr:testis-expressed protein 13A [Orycteropus afer afer]